MSEVQGNEAFQQRSDEVIKALINKVTDNGKAIREQTEQIRNLPDPADTLQGIDQRMAALEKVSKSQTDRLKDLSGELHSNTEKISFPATAIEVLHNELRQHAQLFEKPLDKQVHYTHFLGKPILVIAGMSLVITGLLFFWIRDRGRVEEHTRNDVKWRYMKLTDDSLVLHALEEADRSYLANPEQFEKDVSTEEERRQELYEKWLELQQKMGDWDRLRVEKKGK